MAILFALPALGIAQTAETPKPAADDVKVTVDPNDPTMMIIESKGERLRVNTVTKAVEKLSAVTANAAADESARLPSQLDSFTLELRGELSSLGHDTLFLLVLPVVFLPLAIVLLFSPTLQVIAVAKKKKSKKKLTR